MPSIAKIRLTNIQFEHGDKRFNDELFFFDGHNTAILLENGGGKTVFIQTVIQAMVPNGVMAERKIRDTLDVTSAPAHIAVEWILQHKPRLYALTAVTFFMGRDGLEYLMYAYDYPEGDRHRIEQLPFVQQSSGGRRPATREEIKEYYQKMASASMNASTFNTREAYQAYLEQQFQIVTSEWEAILKINSTEGGVESFFDGCKTTGQLVDRLLIPVVEQGLAGSGSREFARMFDNQRQHFREYLSLSEQIKEYEQVNEHIGRIVEQYAALDQVEETHRRCQSRAAGLHRHLEAELAETAAGSEELAEAGKALATRRDLWHRKKLSLEIARLRCELGGQEARLVELEEERGALADRHLDYHGRIESLRLAGLQADLKAKDEALDHLQQQLDGLDRSPDVARLRKELNDALSGLRYHYDHREADLDRQHQETEQKRTEASRREKAMEQELELVRSDLQDLQIKEAEIGRDIQHIHHQMRDTEQEILDDPSRDQVPDQIRYWDQRSLEIATDLPPLYQRISASRQTKKQLKIELSRLNNRHPEIQKELTAAETQLLTIKEKEKELLAHWHRLSPRDQEIGSLYLRQHTILHRLEEEAVQVENKRKTLMDQERVLLRLYDLYRESKVFTADPALEKWAGSRQQDFPSLQLGTSFVGLYLDEHPERVMGDVYEHYPLWPVTLVAARNDLVRLRSQLERQAQDWTHPVFLLSDQEAQLVLEGGAPALSPVTPAHWPEISRPERFQTWLDEQKEMAGQVTAESRFWDERWREWKTLQDQIGGFWEQYHHERVYQPLKDKLDQARKALQHCRQEILNTDARSEETEGQIEADLQKHQYLEEEQNALSNRLKQGLKWQQLAEKSKRQTLLLEQLQPQITVLRAKSAEILKEQEALEERIEEQRERLQAIHGSLTEMRAEETYRKTRESTAVARDASFDLLREKYFTLETELAGVQKNRGELEWRLSETGREMNRLKEQIANQQEEHQSLITPLEFFPVNGDAEINRLTKLKRSVHRELEGVDARVEKLAKEVERLKGKTEAKEDAYPGSSTDIIGFEDQSLERVTSELQAEEQILATEANQLAQKETALVKLDEELRQVDQDLQIAHGVHHFLGGQIPVVELNAQDLQEYPYRRRQFSEALVQELNLARDEVNRQRKTVDEQKKKFEDYCRREIKDEKTKQQALNGILVKNTYGEITDWADHLQERIRAALSIAEKSLRELDEEVQHFINHLHTHLQRICQELQTIPKMTAVKVEGGRKEIYSLTVPTWNEHEGRAKLRQHLEWMLRELKKDRFLTDHGLEDTSKIKKQLESWLHPKQLFQVIDSGQEIKIRCRKVTSDTQVSAIFTDWARTEKWSGGEKWSKNMTLFLGILNYLAEKRRHIRREKQNHRVVILDNPFGKASSDHVLGPVFFVAKQLGFQLIALTAHAEGKFLRDHFPILYSCRLRPTPDPSISVMTKEKEISRAFFQDTDPFIMERLGEMEQLTLL